MTEIFTIVMIAYDTGHAKLIERNIRYAGVTNQIVHSTDGSSAPDYLRTLDLHSPDISGIDFLETVNNDSFFRQNPIIIFTTADHQRDIGRCFELGCGVYITKPVDYEQFANAIRQLNIFLAIMQGPESING